MTPTDTLIFICILVYRAVRGRDHRDRSDQGGAKRARRGPVFATIGKGHAGPDMLKGKEGALAVGNQYAEIRIPNWDVMSDTELAEALRREKPYAEYMKGK